MRFRTGVVGWERALLGCALLAAAGGPALAAPDREWPLTQNGGTWAAGHVQGIAVDQEGGYIYYSFTNLLVKYDLEGELVGTLAGWTGHLGDLAFNPEDGKLYGSLEYKADEAFYVAVIDVERMNRTGMSAADGEIFRTVYLPEVAADYTADMDGNGRFDGDIGSTADHRYGCSGIDGVGFGPAFGRADGEWLLTVGYGIYGNVDRADNDHQVLLQYDVADWDRYARPLVEAQPHRSGPAVPRGKYFVRTGNTTYGVQTLAYDDGLRRWFMGVYPGQKASFPNFLLFAVDAEEAPVMADLLGVSMPGGEGPEQGLLLRLAPDGSADAGSGVRGWHQKADVGLEPIGGGLFYLAENSGTRGAQTADIRLVRWTGNPTAPFDDVSDEDG